MIWEANIVGCDCKDNAVPSIQLDRYCGTGEDPFRVQVTVGFSYVHLDRYGTKLLIKMLEESLNNMGP